MRLSKFFARCAAAAISIALIACTDPAQPDPDAAAKMGEAETLRDTLPPPSATTPRYVGRWASIAAGCEVPAWTFRADGVSTLGEVSCTFNDVQMTASGYAIQATCTAEGPPTPYDIQISFAESAEAMMVSGGPWDQAPSLVYCGALAQD